jgi:hypothetical protein
VEGAGIAGDFDASVHDLHLNINELYRQIIPSHCGPLLF